MIAMDIEFLSGKFHVEWNDGRFILVSDRLELEPSELVGLGELIRVFCDSQMEESACCDGD